MLDDDIIVCVSCAQKADLENDNMEINKKIDLQVASLKTVLESLKLETVRYLAGNRGRGGTPRHRSGPVPEKFMFFK